MFRSIKRVFYGALLVGIFLCGFTLGNTQVSAGEMALSLRQAVSEAVDVEAAKDYLQDLVAWIDTDRILETMGDLAEKILE